MALALQTELNNFAGILWRGLSTTHYFLDTMTNFSIILNSRISKERKTKFSKNNFNNNKERKIIANYHCDQAIPIRMTF